jgi:hypothetical protein
MITLIRRILKSLFRKRKSPRPTVTWDDTRISCRFPDGSARQMRWDDLKAVTIKTTDEGPWMEDVFLVLFSNRKEHCLSIPQSSAGGQEFFEKLINLPGFDEDAVVKAMSCTSNRSFLCWEEMGWSGETWPGIRRARDYEW